MATISLPGKREDHGPEAAPRAGSASRPRERVVETWLEWLMLAWALWWSWAYVRTALAQRFPQWLGWTAGLW